MKLFLIGLPGAGKTYLAKQISIHIPKLRFIDLDDEIEKSLNLKIHEIFSAFGEDFFRNIESITLKNIISFNDNFVMATGGGTPAFNKNMQIMLSNGLTIYLQTPIDVIMQRIWKKKHLRPLFYNLDSDQMYLKLKALLAERKPYYTQAHIIWDTSNDIIKLIDKIKLALNCQ